MICGKSGGKVCVGPPRRSPPPASSASNRVRTVSLIASSKNLRAALRLRHRGELALQRLGIVAPAVEPIFGHVAWINVLGAAAQRRDAVGSEAGPRGSWVG